MSSTSAPHSEQRSSSLSGAGGSVNTPASQCGPCIAHGTTCSSRQNTARRSPASSTARKPSPGSTATPHQLQRSCDTPAAYPCKIRCTRRHHNRLLHGAFPVRPRLSDDSAPVHPPARVPSRTHVPFSLISGRHRVDRARRCDARSHPAGRRTVRGPDALHRAPPPPATTCLQGAASARTAQATTAVSEPADRHRGSGARDVNAAIQHPGRQTLTRQDGPGPPNDEEPRTLVACGAPRRKKPAASYSPRPLRAKYHRR